jgi:hypothetical protein
MKLKLKAFRIAFPALGFPTDLFNAPTYDIAYGRSQRAVVKELCSDDDSYTYWDKKKAIRTSRDKAEDLYIQEPHPILDGLSNTQVGLMTHCLGVHKGDVSPEKFDRNYFGSHKDHEGCDSLVAIGLMDFHVKFGQTVYHVTDLGKEAVRSLLLVTKGK